MLVKLRKLASLKNVSYVFVIAVILVLVYHANLLNKTSIINDERSDEIDGQYVHLCAKGAKGLVRPRSDLKSNVNSRTRQHALIFLLDGPTQSGKRILYMLQAARFKYHIQYGSVRNLPALIDNNNKGRYAAIIFEDAETYLELNAWNREMLDKYCMEYDVGVIMFVPSTRKKAPRNLSNQKLGHFPITFTTNMEVKEYEVNAVSEILRITRAGQVIQQKLDPDWVIFSSNHSTYDAVSSASLVEPEGLRYRRKKERKSRNKRDMERMSSYEVYEKEVEKILNKNKKCWTVVHDKGMYDQIERVIFGADLHFWMHKILFLDALSYLSHGKLSLPLDRFIQVDIDDIFVSAIGARMKREDVYALIDFQKQMQSRVPNFHFLLGFSGKFYGKGNQEEKPGDEAFLKLKDNFLWFPHMWSHMQAHWFGNSSYLCDYMRPNKLFAERHGFNVTSGYAIAPHHSGIFPVHEPLYDCWREVWDIKTTSTEEYPNLRPEHRRRGFIYKGIKVLPRQTCGLFTHTNYRDKYPGGPEKLDSMINGGNLFQSFLLNQYNIFMTHFSNYGSDRLALYVFDHAIDFVQCWTNLRLQQIPPSELADRYFKDYPDELEPIWTNPCADPRHLEIWDKTKSCEKLPKFVIAGPQKTGTTALQWFLLMHPNLETSKSSPQSFEEVQFFNGNNYLKGLDWYMDFFPLPDKETETVLYEKSANYFDSELAPRRLSALLPKANIVVLLVDPAKRAYSWYQHMLSHDDTTAATYSFYEVLKAKKRGSPAALLSLQTRCLKPGQYADHLDRWLEYLPTRQIILEDGELLIKDPITVLHRLQKSLSLPSVFNYSSAIRFDDKKGFFCQVSETGGSKCLGKGKGREYPEMSNKSRLFLNEYYKDSNKRLYQMLKDRNLPVPQWLLGIAAT